MVLNLLEWSTTIAYDVAVMMLMNDAKYFHFFPIFSTSQRPFTLQV